MSVPSVFSQLYEQAEAFQNIVSNYRYDNTRPESEEERLFSHCLDLFELIFMFGPEINVVHINQSDIQQLLQSPDPNHQLLASIIEEDLQHPSLGNCADWYLFSWHDVLLGGTSPMTIVYSSPNIEREFVQKNIVVRGFGGNALFRDVAPLHQRGHQFKKFMYEYHDSFPLPTVLQDYIRRSMQIDHDVLHHAPIVMTSKYDVLTDSYGNPIYVNGIPILHIPLRIEESDYMIIPNKDVNGNLPIVLSVQGLPGARYIFNMQWNPHAFSIPQEIVQIPLENRVLPETNIKYPYITIDDLLEPRIIQVPKSIDSRRFITCCQGDSYYLLPIRRMYFEYFTPEYLGNSLSVETGDSFDSLRVRLRIPVRGGIIEFHRVYHDENIVKLNINIAITPFYQLEGETYHLLCSKEKNTELQIGNTSSADISTDVTYTSRYQEEKYEVGGYTIYGIWDYIAVRFNDSTANGSLTGLIMPVLTNPGLPHENCVFSIDMTDDYTTIMHKNLFEPMPHTLCIDERIVGILCPEDTLFKSQIKRYFIRTTDSNTAYSSLRNLLSTTHDVMHNPQRGKFLESYNLTFDYDIFPRIGDECIIRPSLHKLNRPLDIEYLRAYFEGLLFIMKQEAMLRYNNSTFDLRVAMPSYLNAVERDNVEHIWEDVRHASGTDVGKETTFVSNSVSLALFTHVSIGLPSNFVNINIDSMHTHISYCDNDGRVRTVCVGMGIGDLFQIIHRFYGNDEAFVRHILQQYFNGNGIYSPDELQAIDSHIQYDQWSLFDIIENELDIHKFRHIFHCGQFGACAIEIGTVYLIGLFYYLGKYLSEMNIGQPHAVVFSGLGIKYLSQYFRNDRSMEHLFDCVIRLVLGDDYEPWHTRILFYENSLQVISKGLLIDGMVVSETFDCFYGLDDNVNEPITFREVIDMNVRDDIHSTFRHFIDVLSSNEIRNALAQELNIGLNIVMSNIRALEQMAMDSVHICLNENLEIKAPEDRCNSALFFWSLKHCLYKLLYNNC